MLIGKLWQQFLLTEQRLLEKIIAVPKSSSYGKLVTFFLGCQSQHTAEECMADGVEIWISGHRYNARFLDLRRHGLIMCELARFLDFRLRDVKSYPAFGGSSGGCSCIRDLMCIFSMELN